MEEERTVRALDDVPLPDLAMGPHQGEGGPAGAAGGAAVRLSDVLPRYDGRSDAAVLLRQVERAQRIVPVRNVADIIPLFLRGDALAV